MPPRCGGTISEQYIFQVRDSTPRQEMTISMKTLHACDNSHRWHQKKLCRQMNDIRGRLDSTQYRSNVSALSRLPRGAAIAFLRNSSNQVGKQCSSIVSNPICEYRTEVSSSNEIPIVSWNLEESGIRA